MFSLVSGVYDSYFAPTQLNLLVVGASGTGKTALLERLKVTQFTKNKKADYSQPTGDEDEQEELPQSFLPLRMRRSAAAALATPHKKKKKTKPKKKASPNNDKSNNSHATPKRNFLACPAPSKYAKKDESSDEEYEIEDEDDHDEDDGIGIGESETTLDALAMNGNTPSTTALGRDSTRSMEDISLRGDSETATAVQTPTTVVTTVPEQNGKEHDDDDEDDEEDEDEQHDLKNKMKMLPLHKIRPTIGMNLGKVEMCGAKCHVWDLGGKMHDLWSRYYQDCDAVIFLWKVVDDKNPPVIAEKDGNESDSSDDQLPLVTAAQQLTLLEQVRESIADDVPFLIWGHWFPQQTKQKSHSVVVKRDKKSYQYDQAYSTSALLPHYHNPLMSAYFGSARSGAGVRTAMEWLIPLAARQKKFRDKSPVSEED